MKAKIFTLLFLYEVFNIALCQGKKYYIYDSPCSNKQETLDKILVLEKKSSALSEKANSSSVSSLKSRTMSDTELMKTSGSKTKSSTKKDKEGMRCMLSLNEVKNAKTYEQLKQIMQEHVEPEESIEYYIGNGHQYIVHGCDPSVFYNGQGEKQVYQGAEKNYNCSNTFEILKDSNKENLVVDPEDNNKESFVIGVRRFCIYLEKKMTPEKAAEIVYSSNKILQHPYIRKNSFSKQKIKSTSQTNNDDSEVSSKKSQSRSKSSSSNRLSASTDANQGEQAVNTPSSVSNKGSRSRSKSSSRLSVSNEANLNSTSEQALNIPSSVSNKASRSRSKSSASTSNRLSVSNENNLNGTSEQASSGSLSRSKPRSRTSASNRQSTSQEGSVNGNGEQSSVSKSKSKSSSSISADSTEASKTNSGEQSSNTLSTSQRSSKRKL